jgi:protein-S-isoprenylcysteine O-methyltransferase Ste14
MAVLARAVAYATLFVSFVLVFLPSRLLSVAGIVGPPRFGPRQVTGILVGTVGMALASWCVVSFALLGRGTPAPFDPPRRLVVRGPYRYVRNPMYVGAGLALAGAALFYESGLLWTYTAGFLLAMHLVVVLYEEPALQASFGGEYETYRRRVRRWGPTL